MDLEDAIKYLLANGHTTTEKLCEAITGVELVEGCVVIDGAPWIADDGNQEVEYDNSEYSSKAAATDYVESGDYGSELSGSVKVTVWRNGIDADGDDCKVDEKSFSIDLAEALDHGPAIRAAMGDDSCGDSPDDHDWTSEGEGGLKENPGVWSLGGTTFLFKSHCRKCGVHRTTTDPGSQRNPGQGKTVEYRMLDGEEMDWHRKNGSMDDADDEVSDD